jgi:hypothetical protein
VTPCGGRVEPTRVRRFAGATRPGRGPLRRRRRPRPRGAWGVVRGTKDCDIVPEPDAANLDRLAATAVDLGGHVQRGEAVLGAAPSIGALLRDGERALIATSLAIWTSSRAWRASRPTTSSGRRPWTSRSPGHGHDLLPRAPAGPLSARHRAPARPGRPRRPRRRPAGGRLSSKPSTTALSHAGGRPESSTGVGAGSFDRGNHLLGLPAGIHTGHPARALWGIGARIKCASS